MFEAIPIVYLYYCGTPAVIIMSFFTEQKPRVIQVCNEILCCFVYRQVLSPVK